MPRHGSLVIVAYCDCKKWISAWPKRYGSFRRASVTLARALQVYPNAQLIAVDRVSNWPVIISALQGKTPLQVRTENAAALEDWAKHRQLARVQNPNLWRRKRRKRVKPVRHNNSAPKERPYEDRYAMALNNVASKDKARAAYRQQLELEAESLRSYIAHAVNDFPKGFTMDELRSMETLLAPHRKRLKTIHRIIARLHL